VWDGLDEREEINDGGTIIKADGERLSTGGSTAWTRSYLRTVRY
jgi:hypothetical protein